MDTLTPSQNRQLLEWLKANMTVDELDLYVGDSWWTPEDGQDYPYWEHNEPFIQRTPNFVF